MSEFFGEDRKRIEWESFGFTRDSVVMVCGDDIDDPDQDKVVILGKTVSPASPIPAVDSEPLGYMVTTKFLDGSLDCVLLLNDELTEFLGHIQENLTEIDYFNVKRIGN